MQDATAQDPIATLKETFSQVTRSDALVPLLVDGLLVTALSACTLGILATPLMVSYSAMCLRVLRGDAVKVGDSLQSMPRLGPALVLALVMFGLVLLGGLAAGVGSLVVMFFLTYACCAYADNPSLGPWEVVTASARLARDHLVETLVIWGVGAGLGSLLAATVVGSVVAYAFAAMLTAVYYRRFVPAPAVTF